MNRRARGDARQDARPRRMAPLEPPRGAIRLVPVVMRVGPPSRSARCWGAVALAGILAAGCGGPAAAPRAAETPPATAVVSRSPSTAATNSASFNAIQALSVQMGPPATMTPPPNYLPDANFRAAAFPTAEDGWVAGTIGPGCSGNNPHDSGGVIESTRDGGSSWSVQYQGADAVLGLVFSDPSNGWALAVPAGEVPACGRPRPGQLHGQALLATVNGGRHWGVVDPQADGLDTLYFTSAAGWAGTTTCASSGGAACSGTLLHSTDAGRHWLAVPAGDPGGLPVIAITGSGHDLWALEAGPTGGSTGGDPAGLTRVVRSTDGGTAWTIAGSLPLKQPGQTAGAVGSLVFTSATRGWATVWAISSCAMAGCSTDAVFQTTDGGWTWTPVIAVQRRCNVARPLVAAGGGTVLVARGVNLAACAGPQTRMVRSTSGGSAWSTATTLPTFRPVALQGTAGASGTPVFWALGGQALLRSTDGGVRWTQVLPAPIPTAAIQFLSTDDGWGVGTLSDPGAILQTTDGGRSWSVVFSVPGAALSDVSFVNTNSGWVAGVTQPWDPQSGQGLLWHTTDGGRSWKAVTAGMRLPALPTISFSGPAQGLLIARGAQIACSSTCPPSNLFATSDGGTSWHSVATVVHPDRLIAVNITPSGAVWGLWMTSGSCSLVLARGGATATGWTAKGCFSGDTGAPALQFVAPSTVFALLLQVLKPAASGQAVVTRPVLLRSVDGGRVWQGTPLPFTVGFFGNHLFFLNNTTDGWLLAGGALWTTTDGGAVWSGRTT